MQVLKFGGTSVADAANMNKVTKIVANAVTRGRTIVVCSAISGCTDRLIGIGRLAAQRDETYRREIDALQETHRVLVEAFLPERRRAEALRQCEEIFALLRTLSQGVFLLGELSRTSLDAIQGCGELLSTLIITLKFEEMGIPTRWMDSREVIRTDFIRGANVVDTRVTYERIAARVAAEPEISLFVAPGFIASDAQGRTTTLGRGGSDYSAALYAVGAKAGVLEIWTDVSGMMTANPKIVPEAQIIPHISYREALELSHFGAKVIYPPTIQPVVAEGIPIYVKNTFAPEDPGTLIEKNPPRSGNRVTGLSNSDNIALISLEGSAMVGIPGFSSRLFDALSRADINIILITQASSVHTMCIAIAARDAEKARRAADSCFAYEISLGKLNPLKVETGFSIVCLVGDDVTGRSGATGRMLAALARAGVRVRATAQGSSERNVSVVVPSDSVEEALRSVHSAFFGTAAETLIPLFVAGYGTVGRAFVRMIADQADAIASRTGKRLRLCGVANSRRYVISLAGLDPEAVPALLEKGEDARGGAYFEALSSLSPAHAVLVDCTASDEMAARYGQLLPQGYDIVACNKRPFSESFDSYRALRAQAASLHRKLRFGTTVGAALPVLETISRCVASGDRLERVEAILSGTLNYLFDSYQGGKDGRTMADWVETARLAGYTEPDPRTDLSGVDFLRKVVILSREAGIPLEREEVVAEPIPDLSDEAAFSKRYAEAEASGAKLRYVATLERSETAPGGWLAKMGFKAVPADHPFFGLKGTDNAVRVQTAFYPSPLLVQGAGAGAQQTASGLLQDILW